MKRVTNSDRVEIIKKQGRSQISKMDSLTSARPSKGFWEGQRVSLLIDEETDIGFKAIINESNEGIIYKNEIFQPLSKGQIIEGYIKKIRDDKKIDLCLYKPGYKKVDSLTERIIEALKAHKGFLPVTDKSPPEAISGLFGVSKKTYKMIVGRLYKNRVISIEDDGIRLIEKRSSISRRHSPVGKLFSNK